MDAQVFGRTLRQMYNDAPDGEKVTMIHLFGIKHGEDIKRKKVAVSEIVSESGIASTYSAEVSKAIKLAKYVRVK